MKGAFFEFILNTYYMCRASASATVGTNCLRLLLWWVVCQRYEPIIYLPGVEPYAYSVMPFSCVEVKGQIDILLDTWINNKLDIKNPDINLKYLI